MGLSVAMVVFKHLTVLWLGLMGSKERLVLAVEQPLPPPRESEREGLKREG